MTGYRKDIIPLEELEKLQRRACVEVVECLRLRLEALDLAKYCPKIVDPFQSIVIALHDVLRPGKDGLFVRPDESACNIERVVEYVCSRMVLQHHRVIKEIWRSPKLLLFLMNEILPDLEAVCRSQPDPFGLNFSSGHNKWGPFQICHILENEILGIDPAFSVRAA